MEEPQKTHHRKSNNSNLVIKFVAVVVIVGLSFFVGTRYEKAHIKTPSTINASTRFGGRTGGFGGGFGGQRGDAVIGSVTAISASSITIDQTRTNTSTTLSISSSTTVTEDGQSSSVSDIQTGDTVIALKSSSSSTTASRIMLNPSFGGGPQQQQNSGSDTTGSATSD
jgi:hypothetical protein